MLVSVSTVKKLGLSLVLGAGIPLATQAQTLPRKTSISLYYSWLQYHGDLGSEWFGHAKVEYGAGLALSRYVAPGLDVGLDLSYGDLKFSATPPKNTQFPIRRFDANVVNVGIPITLKLNNGWALKEDAVVAPYVQVQPGVAYLSSDLYNLQDEVVENRNTLNFDLAAAAGVRFRFSEAVSLFVQTGQHYLLTDQVDGITNQGQKNDRYLQHRLGLTVALGKRQDEDQDGVPDQQDQCAGTPKGVAVDAHGCPPDKDHDGVPDYQDQCPTEAGTLALQGCPDRDGDDVSDSADECPDVPGKPELHGCPDADNDGVPDKNDQCPNTPADVAVDAHGCPPDQDHDGVPDYQDQCPAAPGPAANEGCPYPPKPAPTRPATPRRAAPRKAPTWKAPVRKAPGRK